MTVVILDGTPPGDGSLAPILTILTEVFGRGGAAFWHRRAAANGVSKERLSDRPCAM